MKRKLTSKKTISLIVAATLLATYSAVADTTYNSPRGRGEKIFTTAKANVGEVQMSGSISKLAAERLATITMSGNGRANQSYMPNVESIMSRIQPYCSKANMILSKAESDAQEAFVVSKINDANSLQRIGSILANGLTDASKELEYGDSVGVNHLHFAIAVNQSAVVSSVLVKAQQNSLRDGNATPTVNQVSVNFHDSLYRLIETANTDLDQRFLIPFYSSCGFGPIVVVPNPEIPVVQSSQATQISPQGVPMPMHPQLQHGGRHYRQPSHCGMPFVYVTQVRRLAGMFLNLSMTGSQWTGFANTKVQLAVLKSLLGAAKTVLLMSPIYELYYSGLVYELNQLELKIQSDLNKVGSDGQLNIEIVKIRLSEFYRLKQALEAPAVYINPFGQWQQ